MNKNVEEKMTSKEDKILFGDKDTLFSDTTIKFIDECQEEGDK